jgi:pyridoxamine 5'-phosphate oxidase
MSEHPSIANIRKVYKKNSLSKNDVAPNPIEQFDKWWKEAIAANIDEVNAMSLATCDRNGIPSARIVLLKGIHDDGFVFFTNYTSHKAKDIETNPHVALIFFWKELERQVRVEGHVEKTSDKDSEEYFNSRPRESKIGAWTSRQSEVIPSRRFLQERQESLEEEFSGKEIPRPQFWGGYVVHPEKVEFWQGRPSRLHDRILYVLEEKSWKILRLAP